VRAVILGGLGRKSGRGKKFYGKSIKIYNTKNMKKYQQIFQKCEHGSFVSFMGVATWVNKLTTSRCL